MALSFASGSSQLVNWGFSVGDVAVMAGAGRKVGTWLMVHLQDRTLFEWMKVDVDAVFTRKGLLNVEELQHRWDRKLTLLKNGRPTTFTTSRAGYSLHRMDRWTWVMTLFTAAMDVAVNLTDMKKVLTKVLLTTFEESESGRDFIEREAPGHIEGWRSASCVRGISARARDIWAELASNRKHPPGNIPSSEAGHIVQFFMWLINGNGNKESKRFFTSSTDIFSLAVVLERIGLLITTTECPHDHFDESTTVVCWTSHMPFPMAVAVASKVRRFGMRVPLAHMEEVGSLFPSDRNEMREIFSAAINAVKEDQISLVPSSYVKGSPSKENEQDLVYTFVHSTRSVIPRLEGDNNRFVSWLFLQLTPAVAKAFLKAIHPPQFSQDEEHNLQMIALSLDNQQQDNDRFHDLRTSYDYGDALNHIQMFVLGYWYALLRPLVDASKLPLQVQEAYGAWGWSDMYCLDFIRQCVESKIQLQRLKTAKTFSLPRYEILKLVSYLFGGAESTQTKAAAFGALGILGKLPVVYSSMLGGSPDKFGMFSLLDIDSSCIPSSLSGIVLPGHPGMPLRNDPRSTEIGMVKDFKMQSLLPTTDADLTVHIEPDWGYDAQTCVVVYRFHGRAVHRLDPRQVDIVLACQRLTNAQAVPTVRDPSPDATAGADPPYHISDQYCMVPFSEFFGGAVVYPVERLADTAQEPPGYVFTPLMLNSIGLPHALVCLLCMYHGWKSEYGVEIKMAKNQQEFEDAVQTSAKVIILC
ncbi:hypothetical protein BDV97DRAFT_366781 [Delphinella strobiligena]|nr:hypothetical protein BDV97DRAFT_366781 [Delphinella strobiligena]